MTTSQNTQDNGAHASGEDPGFGRRVDHLGSEAQQLWNDARGAVSDLSQTLDVKGRVERNPYGMMAAAAGVGYVLGGGLFTPLTARILKLGVRLAMLPFVKDELLGMAESALRGYQAGRPSMKDQPHGDGPSNAGGQAGAPSPGNIS